MHERRETRVLERVLPDLAGLISHGASPRATLGLVAASRVLLSYEAIADNAVRPGGLEEELVSIGGGKSGSQAS